VPDGEDALGVAKGELHLGLSVSLDDTRAKIKLLNHQERDVGDGERETREHGEVVHLRRRRGW
jgi:hypothetical protein